MIYEFDIHVQDKHNIRKKHIDTNQSNDLSDQWPFRPTTFRFGSTILRTDDSSDERPFATTTLRNNDPSDERLFRLTTFRTNDPFGSTALQTKDPSDQRPFTRTTLWTNAPSDQRPFGPITLDHTVGPDCGTFEIENLRNL